MRMSTCQTYAGPVKVNYCALWRPIVNLFNYKYLHLRNQFFLIQSSEMSPVKKNRWSNFFFSDADCEGRFDVVMRSILGGSYVHLMCSRSSVASFDDETFSDVTSTRLHEVVCWLQLLTKGSTTNVVGIDRPKKRWMLMNECYSVSLAVSAALIWIHTMSIDIYWAWTITWSCDHLSLEAVILYDRLGYFYLWSLLHSVYNYQTFLISTNKLVKVHEFFPDTAKIANIYMQYVSHSNAINSPYSVMLSNWMT